MSAILVYLKLLYEHKEKIILGALVIAFIGVSADLLRGENGGPNDPGKKPPPPKSGGGTTTPRKPKEYRAPHLGNLQHREILIENTGPEIFAPAKGLSKTVAGKEAAWAEIVIKSVFDATRSGSFIAIIEVDGKRDFVKEGQQFGNYQVTRIDGVKKCLTIVRRGSQSEENKKEFCTED